MNPTDDLDFGQTIRGFVEGQTVFGRYVLKQVLGRGGMGVVWLARDERLERDIALKFLPEMVRLDDGAIDDLKRETRRSLDLTHAHIVRIYDFVEDAQSAAIAMEYVDGATLAAIRVQKPNRVLEADELHGAVEQIVSALTHAHEHAQIVHRDLKPANLMVDGRSRIKITDFGIARSLSDSVSRVSIRQPGATSGSPPYMSPQQVLGKSASVSDDIYSLGATLYDLLTGKPPFYTGNIYLQIADVVPPSMKERRLDLGVEDAAPIPAAWEQTIAACLAKNPADRPQSAADVLQRLTSDTPPPQSKAAVVPAEEPKVSRKRIIISIVSALVVILVAVGVWAGWRVQEKAQAMRAANDARHAELYFQEGNWAEATKLYESSRGTPSTDSRIGQIGEIQATFAEAEKAVEGGNLDGAKAALAKLQDLEVPTPLLDGLEVSILKLEQQGSLASSMAFARKAMEARDWASAIQHANVALRIEPSNAEATALRNEAESKRAEIAKNETAIAEKIRQAESALDWDKLGEARTVLLAVLQSDPGNAKATQLLEKVQAAERRPPPVSTSTPASTPVLTAAEVRVTTAEYGPILTFPTGQRFQIPGSGKGILGPSTDPSRQAPLVSPDGNVVAVTSQPETKSANAYLILKDAAGRFSTPLALNPKLAGFSLPGLMATEYFLRVQRVENDAVVLQAADLTGLQPILGEFALTLVGGKPVFPDGKGFFSDKAVFIGTTYAGYNSYSRNQILRIVQQKLKDMGAYSSTIDGTMGKGTQAAIIKFQAARNILPTGLLNAETLSAMGLTGISENTPPPASRSVTRPQPASPSRPTSAEERVRRAVGL